MVCCALALLCTKPWPGFADGSADAVAGGAVAGRKAVDFENLAFVQGNHLMTNKKCDLPQKSYRAAHKAREQFAYLLDSPCLMLGNVYAASLVFVLLLLDLLPLVAMGDLV